VNFIPWFPEPDPLEMQFLPGQNYDCVRCGRGCREQWRIYADAHTEERIATSELAARRMEETGESSVFDRHPENGSPTMKRHQGACIFLQEDNSCGVHAKLGVNAKPVVCRMFPFLPVNTPDGIFVGITFYCTAAKRNQGRPMDAHVWGLKELLPLQPIHAAGFERQLLRPGSNAGMVWAVYCQLEERVRKGDSARALWALADLSVRVEWDVTPEALAEAWTRAQPERFATDPLLQSQERLFVATLLITMEVAETNARKERIEAFLAGGEFVLPLAGWTGTSQTLDLLVSNTPAWLEEEITRYEQGLIFRKFLALHRPLLANAAVLYVMPRLFRLYAAISAAKRGVSDVEREDAEYAFDRLELFLTHTTNAGIDRTLGEFADGYARQIEEAVREGPR
jgi:hypothetical protein